MLEDTHLSNFGNYSKVIVIKTIWYWPKVKTHRSKVWNRVQKQTHTNVTA